MARVSGSSSRGDSLGRPDSTRHPEDRGSERAEHPRDGSRGEAHGISIVRDHRAQGERPEGKSQIERGAVAAHDEAASRRRAGAHQSDAHSDEREAAGGTKYSAQRQERRLTSSVRQEGCHRRRYEDATDRIRRAPPRAIYQPPGGYPGGCVGEAQHQQHESDGRRPKALLLTEQGKEWEDDALDQQAAD